MNCPYCAGDTKVTNSRSTNENQSVWRRRQCRECLEIWTTKENYQLNKTHRVKIDSNNTHQPFYRDKLFISVMNSLRHRSDALESSSDLTDTIISKVLQLKTEPVSKNSIISITYKTLKRFDSTAAAVYRATHKE